MTKKTTKSIMLFSALAISAILVPGLHIMNTQAIQEQQDIDQLGNLLGFFKNPQQMGSAMGQALGSVGGPDMLADILMLILGQVRNFNDREMLPNVFVFNASASANTTSRTITSSGDAYYSWVPYADEDGNYYYALVDQDYDVNVTFRQEASLVLVLWDNDGSFIKAIKKLLTVVNEALDWLEENPGASVESIPDEFIQAAASTAAWFLMHINDIITGDEQIIFQPTYYWSYSITGDFDDTRTWYNGSTGSIVADPNALSWSTEALNDGYMQYLLGPAIHEVNKTVGDTGFLFHIFQLWLQKFQININMTKLAAMIPGVQGGTLEPTGDMLGNLLEGVDIKFTFTQHHLLGSFLYNDSNDNKKPDITYVNTSASYIDNDNETKYVSYPTVNEMRYKVDLASAGDAWTVTPPTPDIVENELQWGITFNNPTIRFTPLGMDDYQFGLQNLNLTKQMTDMSFGFTFSPSFTDVAVPNKDGTVNKTVNFGKGVVKLDQAFGDVVGGLPAEVTDLDLAVVYFSTIFTFDLSYENIANDTASIVKPEYNASKGTLDFLNFDDADYFGAIDIAGPNYTVGVNTYPAQTTIVPFAFFEFNYEAERNIANDEFSIDQGESAFRRQSLYFDLTYNWAFYCVSYPEWDGTALVHDPTFSIFMVLESDTPWGIILLFVAIGGLVAAGMMLYFKRQGRF